MGAVDGYATLMSPNKSETAVHGCHCPGEMAVRMREVLARPWVWVSVCFAPCFKFVLLIPWILIELSFFCSLQVVSCASPVQCLTERKTVTRRNVKVWKKKENGHCTQTRRLNTMATNFLVGGAIKPVDCWSTKKYKSTTQQLCNRLGFFCYGFSSIKIMKEGKWINARAIFD